MLFNGWFPDGSASTKLGDHAYMNNQGSLSISPVQEIGNNVVLVTNPTNSSETVVKLAFDWDNDTHYIADGSVRSMLLPITPTAADPIVDWGGGSTTARRWYRFSFLTTGWDRETRVRDASQFCVIWQLHDQADTGDNYVEPPLWVVDSGTGYWDLYNTYDANAVTNTSTRTHRLLCRIRQTAYKWEEFVIYMKPSWTSGDLTVWYDQRKIFSETGIPNCFNHLPARGGSYNYTEYGVYGGKTDQLLSRTIYHKGSQIGDEAYTTFNQFMSACGSSLTEKESITRNITHNSIID